MFPHFFYPSKHILWPRDSLSLLLHYSTLKTTFIIILYQVRSSDVRGLFFHKKRKMSVCFINISWRDTERQKEWQGYINLEIPCAFAKVVLPKIVTTPINQWLSVFFFIFTIEFEILTSSLRINFFLMALSLNVPFRLSFNWCNRGSQNKPSLVYFEIGSTFALFLFHAGRAKCFSKRSDPCRLKQNECNLLLCAVFIV